MYLKMIIKRLWDAESKEITNFKLFYVYYYILLYIILDRKSQWPLNFKPTVGIDIEL